MNHIITCSALLFSLLFVSIGTADQTNCSKDDVTGRWTTYSIDLGVADHVEYQEKIDIEYLQTLDGADQFYVSFPGGEARKVISSAYQTCSSAFKFFHTFSKCHAV